MCSESTRTHVGTFGFLFPHRHTYLRRAPIVKLAFAFAAASVASVAGAQMTPPPSLFDYRATRDTIVADSARITTDSLRVARIRFESPLGGTVTATLVTPIRSGPHAGIVMGHGAPGSGANLTPRALYFARRGAVVMVVDAPFARRDPSHPLDISPRDSSDVLQQVVDYRVAFDHLQRMHNVDAQRLGFVGASHSGYVGAILAGAEPRLRAAALAVGDPGYLAHFQDASGTWSEDFSRNTSAEQRERWASAMAPLDGRIWIARSKVPALLLQNSLNDEAVPRHAADALHAAAPPGTDKRWYPTGHRMGTQSLVDQLDHFHRTLGMDAVTESDLTGPYRDGVPAVMPRK